MPQNPPPDFSPPSGWNPFVVGAIAVLFTIFLLLSYYKMMKIQCFSIIEAPIIAYGSERRRLNEDNPNEPSLQFHSRGLDSSIIQRLPTIQYTAKKGDGDTEHGETECAVCLDDFEVGDMLRLLPNCAHSFHIACIDTWFKSHSNCPLCRSNILYSASDHRSYSVSVFTSLETHRREDVIREIGGGSSHESLQNSRVRPPLQQIPFPSIGLF